VVRWVAHGGMTQLINTHESLWGLGEIQKRDINDLRAQNKVGVLKEGGWRTDKRKRAKLTERAR